MTIAVNAVLGWFADNFKMLSAGATAAIVYLIANKDALGLDPRLVIVLGIVPVILAATDPNRDHQSSLNVSLGPTK